MQTKQNQELTIGKAYRLSSFDAKSADFIVPLVLIGTDEAIFVSNAFPFTPFVKWTYKITSKEHDTIEVYSGTYYKTLNEALRANTMIENFFVRK